MFEYEFLRNQWVFVIVFGGLAAVFYVVLHYYDYLRPRKRKKKIRQPDEYETNYMSVWQGIPWAIKVTITLIFVFAVIYSIHAVLHPNSW